MKYLKVWWLFAINSFQTQLVVRWAVVLFLVAKLLRFSIFTMFIVILLKSTNVLSGYSFDQTILFFLSFNIIDNFAQLLFREVYRFRPAVVEGTFDFYLIKPISPLFRSLLGGPDLIDFLTMIPLLAATAYYINKLGITDIGSITVYFLLLIVGFIIALSFHILVLSLAILTTEIDNAIMLYRDVTSLGRMPIDIYREPIRGILTFIIPVGIMMSYPVKALLGLLSPYLIIYAGIFCLVFLFLSLQIWKHALKQYSSASS